MYHPSSDYPWVCDSVIGEHEADTNTGITMVGALRETGGLSAEERDTITRPILS